MHRLVSQHWLSGNIADGINRGIGGLALLVDFDEAFRIHFDLGFVETRNFRVRPTSHRHQHAVEHLFFLFHIRTVKNHPDAILLFFQRLHRSVQQNGGEELFQTLVEWQYKITIRAGQQAGQHFDARHFRSQRRVHRAEFQSDVTAADDQQRLRNVGQVKGAGGIHHAWAIEFEARDHTWSRTGRDDDAVERHVLVAAGHLRYFEGGRIDECRLARHELHGALLRQLSQAAGEFFHHALFPSAELVQIDFGFGEVYAPVFRLLGFFEQFCNMQQSLGWNAAAIKAHAAGIDFRIDHRDLHAQVGGEERGGISARSAADYGDAQVRCVRHCRFLILERRAGMVVRRLPQSSAGNARRRRHRSTGDRTRARAAESSAAQICC